MEKYKRLSANEKWEIIRPVIEGKASVLAIAKKYEMTKSNITKWIRKYNQDGMARLENGKGWKPYMGRKKLNLSN